MAGNTPKWIRSAAQKRQESALDARIAQHEEQLAKLRTDRQSWEAAQRRPTRKRLTVEAQDAQTQRLHDEGCDKRKEKDELRVTKMAQPVVNPLAVQEQDDLVQRLYYDSLERKLEKEEDRDLELEAANTVDLGELDRDELDTFVTRMYDVERERRMAKQEELAEKYQVRPTSQRRPMTKNDIQSSVERLHHAGSTKHKEKLHALASEHLARPVRGKRVDQSEILAIAERLYAPARAASPY